MKSFMKNDSSHYLFLLGLILFGLIFLSFILASTVKKIFPKTYEVKDAGTSLTFKDKNFFTTFETGEDVNKLNSEKQKYLDSYGWINKEKGMVHVPIDIAMDYFIKRQSINE